MELHILGKRSVGGKFDGSLINSDGSGLFLSEVKVRSELQNPRSLSGIEGTGANRRRQPLLRHISWDTEDSHHFK